MKKRTADRLVVVSVICNCMFMASLAHAQPCSQRIAHLSYGIGIDMDGNVWVPEHVSGRLRKYGPGGPLLDTFDMQMSYNRGVAVTPVDNHIWVAHTGFDNTDNRVTRYDPDTGNLCEVITLVGYGPSALAVDADGNVWVTSMAIAVAGAPALPALARIKPADLTDLPPPCGTIGSSASTVVTYDIDLLDGGEDHPDGFAKPYNYSDMTGFVTLQTSATGTWTTVHDGGVYDVIADDEAFIGVDVECAMDSHCDDGNVCTDDACNNGTCVYANDDTNTCSDGNDCTDDACSSGTCASTNDDTNTCTDGNDCTADSCLSGVCTSANEPVNTVCDDGFFCTKRDRCDGAGTCVGIGNPCFGQNPICCEQTDTCGPLPCT